MDEQHRFSFYVFWVMAFFYAFHYLGNINILVCSLDQTLSRLRLLPYASAAETKIKLEKNSTPRNQFKQNKFTPHPTFKISVKSALKKYQKSQNVIFIDVREPKKFELYRIPGSLNIPLYALKSKNFLMQKSLILVNEGFKVLDLKKECIHLEGTGFQDVKFLKGGLNAWKENNGAIQGDVFAMKKLNRVSPDCLFKEKNNENLLLIDISAPENVNAGHDLTKLAEAVPIPLKIEDALPFCKKVKSVIQNNGTTSSPVLMFNKDGKNYDRIDRLLRSAGIKSIFYLEDGSQGYRKYESMQAKMGQPKRLSTNRGHKCTTCP
nr:rhodanese-like domain-containing protein [uncultured Desulfobacter sp.]